jgi:hypothetical protein
MTYLRPACVLIALLLIGAAAPAATQAPGLRIVVIEGEDAVNIIQQKTAVAPLVEVRDRNNLPVPGVAVTFTVGGQGASFGGLSTLTVTTNAAGQAAAVGLTPTAAGAVQINAAAVFQGQTAVATITQTNVLTAAQAASAAGATSGATGGAGSGGSAGASGAAAGGGGGGLSATTIGIVGAAVGGGALVATQVGGGEEGEKKREWAGAFSGDLVMTFGACVRVERHSGTLTIELDYPVPDGAVNGTSGIEGGTVNIISTTAACAGGPQPGQTQTFGIPKTPVSGPKSSITFSQTLSNPAVDGSGIVTTTYRFTGSMTGDTIAGTLVKTVRLDSASGVVTGTATSPVTLTPH